MMKEYYDHGHPIHVIGFGWCWTMSASYLSLTRDPIYKVKWYGTSHGGPGDNTHGFGLDAGDYSITGNPVSLDTYLNAVQDYNEYCKTNAYPTKVIFTTGPVDNYKGEQGYQAFLKHEHIRSFVKADPTRILFDYADILCYDDNGNSNTESWTFDGVTYTYPFITAKNLGDTNVGHIGIEGAIRLAKAEWWLLARMAGWDGQ
jgi:hypothetical protein